MPRSIYYLITVVYSASAGVIMDGKRRHRRARLSTMEINSDAILALTWMRRYADSIYFFLVRMILDVHLICMAAIMWIMMRRQNTYKHCCGVSFKTRLFTNNPYGPGN